MLYGIIGIISIIVRNFFLPNPFEQLGEGIMIGNALLTPIVLNWITEIILHPLVFVEVGVFYRKGELPWLGSLLYLMFYIINVCVLWAASSLGFHWYTNSLILVLYIAGFIATARGLDV